MGATITAIVIAVLAGIGTYYTWERNKGLSMGLAVVTAIAGAVGTLLAFVQALALVFKLLPILLLALGIWLIWKVARSRNNSTETID